MNKQERTELKNKIEAELNRVRQDVADLKEQTKPIAPENSIGRVSRMDAINNKSVHEAALRKSEEKLKNLKIAIVKVDDPAFGICARCKQPIPVPRLMLMPESTRCVNCADR